MPILKLNLLEFVQKIRAWFLDFGLIRVMIHELKIGFELVLV